MNHTCDTLSEIGVKQKNVYVFIHAWNFKKYCFAICDLALFRIESPWISNRIPIKSYTFKSNLLLLKSNLHNWFNRDLNRIAIWICPSLVHALILHFFYLIVMDCWKHCKGYKFVLSVARPRTKKLSASGGWADFLNSAICSPKTAHGSIPLVPVLWRRRCVFTLLS